jgi:hypothetical protein
MNDMKSRAARLLILFVSMLLFLSDYGVSFAQNAGTAKAIYYVK